jgi:hypothetical protein
MGVAVSDHGIVTDAAMTAAGLRDLLVHEGRVSLDGDRTDDTFVLNRTAPGGQARRAWLP